MSTDEDGVSQRLSSNNKPSSLFDQETDDDNGFVTELPVTIPRPSFLSDGLDNSLNGIDDRSEDRSGSNGEQAGKTSHQPELAAEETKAVNCIKIIVLIILLLVSCGFAVVVYKFTRNEESETFEETFFVYAQQIEYAIQISAQNRLEAVGALAFQIQSYVHDANMTWPFVTVSFFEDRVHSMKTLTDAYVISLVPIVAHKDRAAWEEYSVENRQWVNESYAAQRIRTGTTTDQLHLTSNQTWIEALWGEGFRNHRSPDFSSGIGGRIYGVWDPQDSTTFPGLFVYPDRDAYLPQWQIAPMSRYSQAAINLNYAQFDDFSNASSLSVKTGNAVLGPVWNDTTTGFVTTMIYPIYREIYPGENDESMDVAAFLAVDIDWSFYLTGIFQEEAARAVVVIENYVGQMVTYKINGDSVVLVGEKDTHDLAYDHMEESFIFGGHLASGTVAENSSYTGALLNPDWVQYTIRIYPSQDLEESFYTPQPIVYTVVVLLVALIASGTFFLYDFLVERRQKVVLRTAERSDAIVSSLFPNKVKEQLYQTSAGDSSHGNKSSKKPPSTTLTKEKKIEMDGHTRDCAEAEQNQSTGTVIIPTGNKMMEGDVARLQPTGNRKLEGPPIAELYEAATVFFADIVGFTAWSSQRSPADVFTLLETCYGAFDVVADRRGVFKVETIGDCYVAVSGIPIRRDDHAIIMAKFARDVLNTMSEQLGNLVPILGSSTASLAMRVGIHSGPVTAGVLRGDRARFQLFGDTVNTAARMESTGMRNRIQLSQATADLLINAGKAAWIAKRSEEVEAKGKGRMQTYWLQCSVASYPVSNPSTVNGQ